MYHNFDSAFAVPNLWIHGTKGMMRSCCHLLCLQDTGWRTR